MITVFRYFGIIRDWLGDITVIFCNNKRTIRRLNSILFMMCYLSSWVKAILEVQLAFPVRSARPSSFSIFSCYKFFPCVLRIVALYGYTTQATFRTNRWNTLHKQMEEREYTFEVVILELSLVSAVQITTLSEPACII